MKPILQRPVSARPDRLALVQLIPLALPPPQLTRRLHQRENDGRGHDRTRARAGNDCVQTTVSSDPHNRQDHATTLNLVLGSAHIRGAVNDGHIILVRAHSVERHLVFFRSFLGDRQRDRNRIADFDRMEKSQVLAEIDRARPG